MSGWTLSFSLLHNMLSIAGGYQEQEKELRLKIREVGLCPEDYFPRDLDSSLSGGEMKRIEMAQILLHDSQVSIFDEPRYPRGGSARRGAGQRYGIW